MNDPQTLHRRRLRIAKVIAGLFFPALVILIVFGLKSSDIYKTKAGAAPPPTKARPKVTSAAKQAAQIKAATAEVRKAEQAKLAALKAEVARAELDSAKNSKTQAAKLAALKAELAKSTAVEAPVPMLRVVFPGEFKPNKRWPQKVLASEQNKFVTAVTRCTGPIQVLGHTDSQGSEKANLLLGMRRADYVRDLLITKGVDPGRLSTGTAGEKAPAGADEALNRRVTIKCPLKKT